MVKLIRRRADLLSAGSQDWGRRPELRRPRACESLRHASVEVIPSIGHPWVAEKRRGGLMILPSLKHLAKPLFQSQKLLWIGWRLVSSTIEQRPERLGHVLLKAHSP
ncbi:hypothetical protein, partial [Mesorhizobium sp. L103C120A0]|uniref:hypothetical protein n=1 Tax=Mesorhizobium sp. L103C120A0 TaxID=1287086 RepID=UPI0012DE5AFB